MTIEALNLGTLGATVTTIVTIENDDGTRHTLQRDVWCKLKHPDTVTAYRDQAALHSPQYAEDIL